LWKAIKHLKGEEENMLTSVFLEILTTQKAPQGLDRVSVANGYMENVARKDRRGDDIDNSTVGFVTQLSYIVMSQPQVIRNYWFATNVPEFKPEESEEPTEQERRNILAGGKTFADQAPVIWQELHGTRIISSDVAFVRFFLETEFLRSGYPWPAQDTLDLQRYFNSYNLKELMEKFDVKPNDVAFNAQKFFNATSPLYNDIPDARRDCVASFSCYRAAVNQKRIVPWNFERE
jgi:hypothetical protein